jgi:hypothetical protein
MDDQSRRLLQCLAFGNPRGENQVSDSGHQPAIWTSEGMCYLGVCAEDSRVKAMASAEVASTGMDFCFACHCGG